MLIRPFMGSQVTSLEDFIFVSVMLQGEVFELSGPGIESEHISAFADARSQDCNSETIRSISECCELSGLLF
jgi:hypothetical protein